MKFQTLPYIPPDPQLTAWHGSDTLAEHLKGFLCVNNRNGFKQDLSTIPPEGTIGHVFHLFATASRVTHRTLQYRAKQVRDLSQREIGLCRAYDYLSQCLGYKNYNELLDLNNETHIVSVRIHE